MGSAKVFEGMNILVTGGTSGIGKCIADMFAQKGANRVFINGRNEEKGNLVLEELNAKHPGHFHLILADVSDEAATERMFSEIQSVLGKEQHLHIAINNAGILGYCGKLHTIPKGIGPGSQSAYLYDPVLNNYYGTRNCLREEILYWIRNQMSEGIVVNITSANGLTSSPGNASYAASKAAVIALTKSAALEYGRFSQDTHFRFKARINCVAPGAVDTPFLRNQLKLPLQVWEGSDITPDSHQYKEFMKHMATILPNGRIASPEDIANAVHFLCSPESSYINGAVLSVDGGISSGWTGLE